MKTRLLAGSGFFLLCAVALAVFGYVAFAAVCVLLAIAWGD